MIPRTLRFGWTSLHLALLTALPIHAVEAAPSTPPSSAPIAEALASASASPRFVLTSGAPAPAGLRLDVVREGEVFRFTAVNDSPEPVALREIVLADFPHGFPADSALYGEGFNMFSSTGGTLAEPRDLDTLTDRTHYRLPEATGFRSVYNYLRATPPGAATSLVGFASCRRFHGKINFNTERLQLVAVTENLTLAPGARWQLEDVFAASSSDTSALLSAFATRIETRHPRLPWPVAPNGWCSWYAYYQNISSERILSNLAALQARAPGLRYIQIDDGYQPWMGDWLISTDKFAGGVQPVIRSIREAGFEPAIWVAPFIASPQSQLFRDHPEWFVRGTDDLPLRSDQVTFGGWRQGPWYMLDATHPDARAYLETVFRTLRAWGCTYFKLDANLWGSFPVGRRHDPQATSVEAYRLGMDAIRRGAGPDSLLLACNQAYWPSLGTVHASRTSYDVNRDLPTFRRVARQNLLRNWMNDRLWWNDPDCLLIPDVTPSASGFEAGPTFSRQKKITPDHFGFHAAATYASGGMILSGDAVVNYSAAQWDILHRAMTRPPLAARFTDDRLEVGVIDEPARRVVVLLNWEDTPATRRIPLADRFSGAAVRITDFWSGQTVTESTRADFDLSLPPGAGRVLVLKKASVP